MDLPSVKISSDDNGAGFNRLYHRSLVAAKQYYDFNRF